MLALVTMTACILFRWWNVLLDVLTFVQVHLPLDPVTKQHKGIGYVTFVQPSSAASAYEALDRKSFQGRLLHILGAVDPKGKSQGQEVEGHKKSLKADRLTKRKAGASRDFNWGMLYMNVRYSSFRSSTAYQFRFTVLERCRRLIYCGPYGY